MISKYFQKYCSYYLSKYWVTKKKFENILKNKISKDLFQKKITESEKMHYKDEISIVLKYYEDMGFFDEPKLIEIKLENLMNRGYSFQKIKYYLQKDCFNMSLISSKISELETRKDVSENLMMKYLSRSGIIKKKTPNFTSEKNFDKILRKLLNQGFDYNDSVNFIKNRLKKYGVS